MESEIEYLKRKIHEEDEWINSYDEALIIRHLDRQESYINRLKQIRNAFVLFQ